MLAHKWNSAKTGRRQLQPLVRRPRSHASQCPQMTLPERVTPMGPTTTHSLPRRDNCNVTELTPPKLSWWRRHADGLIAVSSRGTATVSSDCWCGCPNERKVVKPSPGQVVTSA